MDSHARQQLLELVYDLLPASEAAELAERIRSDPAWAAAYAEAQEAARLMAEAARLPRRRAAALPWHAEQFGQSGRGARRSVRRPTLGQGPPCAGRWPGPPTGRSG